jgi:phosphoribosyl-ATP pyrophosphohydrolase
MILDDLEALLRERLVAAPEGSYSATLLTDSEKARRKIMEEAFELTLELGRHPIDRARTAEEAADLVFHALAGLVAAGVPLSSVYTVLEGRFQ